MQTGSLKLFSTLNSLRKSLDQNDPGYSDKLCELLVDEFGFQSAILFKINDNNQLVVIGKSSSVKKSFTPNSVVSCAKCNLVNAETEHLEFISNSECGIQSTDYLLYEGCQLIKTSPTERYLLKISQKNSFTQKDKEILNTVGEFIGNLISDWKGEIPLKDLSIHSLLSEIANELRTPTNSIVGFASLLSDDKLTSTQNEYVQSLKDNAQKLLTLINDLIDIAKVDNGISTISSSGVDIKVLLQEVIQLVSEKIDKSKYSFNTEIDKTLTDIIKTDIQKLKIVITNILGYVITSVDSSQISIAVFQSKNKLGVKINATGLVIPSSKIKDLFHPSSYANLQQKKNSNTTVLGLALVKRYISLLDGQIDVTSSMGRGTQFNFTVKSKLLTAIEEQISALPKAGQKNKVLVIEDDYATSKLLSNYLNKWGYEPTIVNTGEAALKLLEKEIFLSIITDIVLPDYNGLELLKKIRENKSTKNTPVIVCSVEAEQQKAFMMGAVEYFVKPIKYKDLVEVLTSYKLKKDSNVLCVDDDIPTLNLVKEAIESVGYNAVAESRSSKVMSLIQNVDLDLAIVDLDMPEVNGFELIKMIKSDPKFANLPIMIYTGKENYEDDLKKIDGLFTELLSKRSTNIEDLAQTINAMINRYDEPTPPEIAAKQVDTPKILLVEDYKHSQIIVTRLLKKNNFSSIVVVENGAEAVEQVKKQKFDIILMDMQMPVMNGFEATERIRKMPEYNETPIIALTAFAMKGDREKCLEAGATDYVPKPIDSQEFIEKVKYYTSNVLN
ncbi:MAG: response regulator [Ignavibacteria bacterium]|jgi:CheY-like chemotaxis protein/two-component sensor histidine kinase|nr:response regulator [Ignavibacteria bacterium]